MATTDTKVDLVINELSEEQLQALKAAGTVTPNQLWGTPDESLSSTPILLWENSNTAATFTEQNITLNQSYKNFKYIRVIVKFSKSDNILNCFDAPTSGAYTRINVVGNNANGCVVQVRDITLGTDGNLTIGHCFGAVGNQPYSMNDDGCIPYQIWGLQAISSDVYEDDKIKKVETIYDMNSSDANLNWGYTSGIGNGITINKNFSKYKMLICQYQSYNNAIVGFCDLTTPTTPADQTGRYVLYAVGYIGNGYNEFIGIINLEKTTLTTYLPGSGFAASKITKLYGVY